MRLLRLAPLLAALAATAATRPTEPRTVRLAANLAAAIAQPGIVVGQLRAGDLDDAQQEALRRWVAAGGTLWCETDLSRLFGFEVIPVEPRERIGRARRACGVGAASFCAQVEEVFYRFGADGVMLGGHPSACPLLEQVDPPVARRQRPIVAAELWYGQGRVVHRPGEIHTGRLQGKAFDGNLKVFSGRREDEVPVPIDQLSLASRAAEEALDKLDGAPDEARKSLWRIVLAYRLWYAEYLIGFDRLDEALAHLRVVATELPEEPAVYLAVAHLNEKLGRKLPADEAYQKARDGYAALGLGIPGPDVRQLRVPWPTFVACLNGAQAAYDEPDRAKLDEVAGRLHFLLGLDAYRAGNLNETTDRWRRSERMAPRWALPPYHLGLLAYSTAQPLAQPNANRLEALQVSSSLFLKASQAAETEEFPAAAKAAAKAWSEAALKQAVLLADLPSSARVTPHFVIRYDPRDDRFSTDLTMDQMSAAFERAYEALTVFGIQLDVTEVVVVRDYAALRASLPAIGATPQTAEMIASVGRRLYCYPQIKELSQFARHEMVHVLVAALCEDGLTPPLWITEGLATGLENDGRKAAQARLKMNRGQVMTVQQLNDPAIAYARDTTDHAFGQSQIMAEALLQRFGVANLVPFLQLCGWGTAPATAFEQWTSLTPEAFLNALLQNQLGG